MLHIYILCKGIQTHTKAHSIHSSNNDSLTTIISHQFVIIFISFNLVTFYFTYVCVCASVWVFGIILSFGHFGRLAAACGELCFRHFCITCFERLNEKAQNKVEKIKKGSRKNNGNAKGKSFKEKWRKWGTR